MQSRETYLHESLDHLQRRVFTTHTIPADVRITCGWPSKGATSKLRRIGECWPRSRSAANVNEIFISPTIADTGEALAILVHELVHAIDDCQHGHGKQFRAIAIAAGLEGKMTATTASPELAETLADIQTDIGDYPHAALTPPGPKQKSRQLKLSCDDCGAVWRMAKAWQDKATGCPCCLSDNILIG
jgi:hypothetical protein